jgi:C_GCAxxG_C_C family probable redox protein
MLAVGQEKIGKVNEEIVKAAGSFGGGIAASGGPCGIMLGAVSLFSSMYSRGNLEGKEDPRMWVLPNIFMKKFETLCEKYGGTNCSEIARVNWHNRDEAKEYYKNPDSRRKECIELIGEAAAVLVEILEKDRKRKE